MSDEPNEQDGLGEEDRVKELTKYLQDANRVIDVHTKRIEELEGELIEWKKRKDPIGIKTYDGTGDEDSGMVPTKMLEKANRFLTVQMKRIYELEGEISGLLELERENVVLKQRKAAEPSLSDDVSSLRRQLKTQAAKHWTMLKYIRARLQQRRKINPAVAAEIIKKIDEDLATEELADGK